MDPINKLIQIKHKKLKVVKNQLFKTVYAFDIDVYKPQTNAGGEHVLEDEGDFLEPDVVGSLKEEDMPIQYGFLSTSKAVEIVIDEGGKLSYVRSGEISEFDPDKNYKLLIQDNDIPIQTVIMFELPISTENDNTQVISLIKVEQEAVKGKTPFIDIVHIFAPFHGDFS